ncbi:MAG: aldehyde dehydrogenase family protein [Chloroflexota bacterium]
MVIERILHGDVAADAPKLGSFIDGRLAAVDDLDKADLLEVVDPATSRPLARIAEAGGAGIARAVAAGRRAFPAWRATPARERAALVMELGRRIEVHADELALLDSLDTGNPITAMRADVTKGVRLLGDAAGMALAIRGEVFPLPGLHYTQREPWGVVGRMITFNHPTMFTCARLGAALVAGNCVILKPSELAPLAPLAIGELSADLFPAGVIAVAVGGPATGSALVTHPDVARLSFTGSTATALRIQAAAAASGRIKTFTFELGGKNPIVVCPDVDVNEVAGAIVRGMNYTRVQGQSCGSTSRLVIHESIADAVLEQVVELVGRIRIGLPTDPETEMGAMISEAARARCLEMVGRGVAAGARLRAGGRAPAVVDLAAGAYIEPTILDHVTPGSELADAEVFGPVLAALTWRTDAEAIALANEGPYGLTASVWTRDIDRAFRMTDAIEAGYIWINDVETRFPAVPFGGWKDSGVGAEHGLDEILSFTRVKAVNLRVR